ncbi:MAG: hypothetical protein MZW92_09095 [Comamonadaceae bacterium]|nr:hypothetical protein [Comamonadaceae bacterium]
MRETAGRLARRQRRSTWRRWSTCCCASRKWSASCRSCAEMDINPHHRRRIGRGGGGRAHRDRQRAAGARGRPATTTTWRSCPTRRSYEQVWPLRGGGEVHRAPDPPGRRARCCRTLVQQPVAREPLLPLRHRRCMSCRRRCWRASR